MYLCFFVVQYNRKLAIFSCWFLSCGRGFFFRRGFQYYGRSRPHWRRCPFCRRLRTSVSTLQVLAGVSFYLAAKFQGDQDGMGKINSSKQEEKDSVKMIILQAGSKK